MVYYPHCPVVWEKKDFFLLPYSLGRRQVISLFPAKQETLVSRVSMTCNPHFSHRLLTAAYGSTKIFASNSEKM